MQKASVTTRQVSYHSNYNVVKLKIRTSMYMHVLESIHY